MSESDSLRTSDASVSEEGVETLPHDPIPMLAWSLLVGVICPGVWRSVMEVTAVHRTGSSRRQWSASCSSTGNRTTGGLEGSVCGRLGR